MTPLGLFGELTRIARVFGLADARMARVRHVGVQVGRVTVEHAPGGSQDGRRRLDLGIAQREVEDLVGAALLLEPGALLEHATDPRRFRQILGDGPGDDHGGSIVHAWRYRTWAAEAMGRAWDGEPT